MARQASLNPLLTLLTEIETVDSLAEPKTIAIHATAGRY